MQNTQTVVQKHTTVFTIAFVWRSKQVFLKLQSGYKFFCSFIVVKKRSNSSVCKTRNKHRVATKIVFLRTLCFKPKAVDKAKHILFYYRADCLSG